MQVEKGGESGSLRVIVEYSAIDSVLRISFVRNSGLDQKSFHVSDIPIADLVSKGGDLAATLVGDVVLSLMQRLTSGAIGYVTASGSGQIANLDKRMLERANTGDADAQNYVGTKLISDAVEFLDGTMLQTAEDWLQKAAVGGHAGAAAFLSKTWPEMKQLLLRKIRQGKAP